MNKDDNPIAAFGSAEEGNEPLKPYIDPSLFETLDRQAQTDLLTSVFDAITLAGVDYDLKVQDSATGKRYTLLKNEEVLEIVPMDSHFSDKILAAIDKNKEE
ncbi:MULTISPECIES: hypothetical protein [unclassified Psychrobacter]|uniref:hypothetical protein n=1 Tax=unclassified Psychrobacter TaxID=196806 RepID=UPI0025B60052|nr:MULTISPECIES: hypothetical protein [unclassified Psychrobacter]MDN3452759.1 hypothetical protein [Psychrobacter sp. APC 3350]MDN3502666.1 hypothetical protein [Psychrobacter sp. 5A.1]